MTQPYKTMVWTNCTLMVEWADEILNSREQKRCPWLVQSSQALECTWAGKMEPGISSLWDVARSSEREREREMCPIDKASTSVSLQIGEVCTIDPSSWCRTKF